MKVILYLHITAEILDTKVNMNTALKFFTVLYFGENHPSAVEMDHPVQFEQKGKDSHEQITDRTQQRSRISAKTVAH